MASLSSFRSLHPLNCGLFLLALSLCVPYGVESALGWGADLPVTLFPTLGVVPSFLSAAFSFIVLTKGGEVKKWPTRWLIVSFVVDLALSIGLFSIIIASYVLIGENQRPNLVVLGCHVIIVLLVQLLSQIHLTISTLFELRLRNTTCPHCGNSTACAAADTTFKGFYQPLRRARGEDMEAGLDPEHPSRITLPVSPTFDKALEMSKAVKQLRLLTCVLAFGFAPLFIVPFHLIYNVTLAPLLTSAFFCLIMTTNLAKKAQAEKLLVYWLVAGADAVIGAGNLTMAIFHMFLYRPHPASFILVIFAVSHFYFVGAAIQGAVKAMMRGQQSPTSMSLYTEPGPISFRDNEASGSGTIPAKQPPTETARPSTDTQERPSIEATEDQRLLDP